MIETPATPIVTPSPVTRSEVPASRLSVVSKPPSVNVSSTWRPVVLISSANAPPSVTPGTFCSATVPLQAAGDAAGGAAQQDQRAGALGQRQQVLRAVAEAEGDVGQRRA